VFIFLPLAERSAQVSVLYFLTISGDRIMGRYDQNSKVYDKWLKEDRGQGRGRDYKPWLMVYNAPSYGRSHRVYSHTSERVVRCLSDLELSVFLQLEWSESVRNIREQFPLSLASTLEIAERIGAKHPAIRGEKMMLTTDFLATVSDPNSPLLAIQVKPSSELGKPRVREIIALEQAFWQESKVHFQVLTEGSLDRIKIDNIKWLHLLMTNDAVTDAQLETAGFWKSILKRKKDSNLIRMAPQIDKQREKQGGISLSEQRLLFASRLAKFDMSIPYYKNGACDVVFKSNLAP
tara:strand:- start:1557 stop:2432 length:876 start_codon:yes stop_codon:yes gene_type:complete